MGLRPELPEIRGVPLLDEPLSVHLYLPHGSGRPHPFQQLHFCGLLNGLVGKHTKPIPTTAGQNRCGNSKELLQ